MRRSSVFLSICLAAIPCGLRAQAAGGPSDSEIIRQFEQRREIILNRATGSAEVAKVDPWSIADADFYQRTDLAWANAELLKTYVTTPRDDINVFWMFPLVSMMETGRDSLSAAAQARVRNLWRTCFPFRLDTENHWLLYYTSLTLAAEANPDAGPEAWYNGKSSAENIAEARSYIEDWMAITTSYGQGEFNSPNYLEEYSTALALLAGWERDPVFRQEARMMLDYMFYDYAVEQLNGEYGGAHSRVYPWQVVQPGQTPAAAIGWLLFGLGEYQRNNTTIILAASGYTPPPILYRIAHDRIQPYVNRELKRTRWRMRHAGPKAFAIEGKSTIAVHNYTYMDPDFVMGSCQGGLLQPIQQQTWSLIWRENRTLNHENTFFGLQPYSSSFEGTMYFGEKVDLIVHSIAYGGAVAKGDYDSPDKLEGGSPYEQVFQQGPALIALYNMPPGNRFPLIDTFFSRDLLHRDIDPSGWIFCQGGPVYFAYRPFAPGVWKPMGWTGVLARQNDSWFSNGYLSYSHADQCLVSASLKNGYIVQAAPVRSFRTFESFKAAVRALPVSITRDPVPEASFTTLDGSAMHVRYGGIPQVNGTPQDRANWPLFDNPFGYAARGSRKLEMRYGAERYTLDFNSVTVDQTSLDQ